MNSSEQDRLAGTSRYNVYAGIHKALRAFMCDTLTRLGNTDVQDEAHVENTLSQLTALLEQMRRHVGHENRFIHPALEQAESGSSGHIGAQHEEHLAELDRLGELAQRFTSAAPHLRDLARQELYFAFSLFMADNLEHMHYEETAHNAVLWAHYTDDELAHLHQSVVASLDPQEMSLVLAWILPSSAAQERLALLSDMRMHAPPPVFDSVLGLARAKLSTADWHKLAKGLGLPPAPQVWPEYVAAH